MARTTRWAVYHLLIVECNIQFTINKKQPNLSFKLGFNNKKIDVTSMWCIYFSSQEWFTCNQEKQLNTITELLIIEPFSKPVDPALLSK